MSVEIPQLPAQATTSSLAVVANSADEARAIEQEKEKKFAALEESLVEPIALARLQSEATVVKIGAGCQQQR